jgi:hypothetical protein
VSQQAAIYSQTFFSQSPPQKSGVSCCLSIVAKNLKVTERKGHAVLLAAKHYQTLFKLNLAASQLLQLWNFSSRIIIIGILASCHKKLMQLTLVIF